MSELIENQCPNCSATIKFDSKLKIMKCPYCDSEFRLSGTTVQDEVDNEDSIIPHSIYQKEYPNYEKMYYTVCTNNISIGLMAIALIVMSIGFITLIISDMKLVTLGELVSHIGFFIKLSMYYFITSLIVKLFCLNKINQLKDPKYDHTDLILSIQSQMENEKDPLNVKYYSQHGGTFFLCF